jgi:hypothetical protein
MEENSFLGGKQLLRKIIAVYLPPSVACLSPSPVFVARRG